MSALSGLIILVAFVVAVIALRAKFNAGKQLSWEKAEGRITSSDVEMSGGYWVPVVKYEYSYQGRLYRSDRIRSLEISVNWRSPAESTVAKFSAGAPVVVYVNPADSTYSVLEPGGDSRFLPLLLVVSAALVGIGMWILA
jgi:hypothetical protein